MLWIEVIWITFFQKINLKFIRRHLGLMFCEKGRRVRIYYKPNVLKRVLSAMTPTVVYTFEKLLNRTEYCNAALLTEHF